MEKKYNKEFLQYLSSVKYTHSLEIILGRKEKENLYLISNLKIKGESITGLKFDEMRFDKCVFTNVHFESITFEYSQFRNCTFNGCTIRNTSFNDCSIESCKFINTFLYDGVFENCSFYDTTFSQGIKNEEPFDYTLIDITFDSCEFTKVVFERALIGSVAFHSFNLKNSITFADSEIQNCQFVQADLRNAVFARCQYISNGFVDCSISVKTFNKMELDKNQDTCYIDLQTIIKNDMTPEVLKMFGIHNSDAQEYIKELVTEIQFQSVFISYSFEDKEFARLLNEFLRRYGVNTFLWERDAPGGKRLKSIMSDNIQKHDRLLFIASEYSLKSEACHYELNEAREKQNKEWKDIYYPIHIDDYLFKVQKERIPPKYRESFWENIIEVKEFNSKDFTKFRCVGSFDMKDFDAAVKSLVKDIKL